MCVYICVWEGGGAGWGGLVMWVCKREKEMDVWVCMCLNSCIFNLCLNWFAYFSRVYTCRWYIYSETLIHVPPPPFLCSSNSTHSILPHGSYFLVLRLIETAFPQVTSSRPNIATRMSQSTNFSLKQGQSILKCPLMGMVYTQNTITCKHPSQNRQ